MFASQLLRVLQTRPTKVNHETCAFDTVESKETMKENQNGILCHSNGYGKGADTLVSEMNNKDEFCNTRELKCSLVTDDFTNSTENADSLASETNGTDEFLNTPKPEFSVVVDDFTNGNENENRDAAAPCSIPSRLFEDTDFYTDKNVVECDLPELMVCYKESTYYDVKDICIDQGVPSSDDKIVIENREVDYKELCTSLPCDENEQSDEGKESVDIEYLIPDGLKSSLENVCDKDSARECETKEKMDVELLIPDGLKYSSKVDIAEDSTQMGETDGNATEKVIGDASTEEFVPSGMLPEQEFRTQKSLESLFQSSIYDGNEVEQQSGQISCAEAVLENIVVISAAEDLKKNDSADNISYNRKVETETIPFDFDSSKSAAGDNDDNPELVCEKLLQSQNVPSVDNGVSDTLSVTSEVRAGEGKSSSYVHEQTVGSQNVSTHHNVVADPFSVSNHVQYGGGESSFSLSGPLSGLETYSGPIAFSGSISVRSDSSTTSTRSFAFPVLQHEYNSSPVRMAKADRRHFGKQRGWRHGFLCCRF